LKSLIVSAPGRLCLFGEHMDWCRRSVLPAAIDMRVFVQAKSTGKDLVDVYSYPPFEPYTSFPASNPNLNHRGDLKYVHGVVEAYRRRGIKLKGLEIRFLRANETAMESKESSRGLVDLPAQKGLSSSAAICVASSAIIDLLQSKNPSKDLKSPEKLSLYADLAYTAERKILGINCGQMDQYASAFGGILYIDCRGEPAKVQALKPKIDLPLVIGDTMQAKDTPKILGWLGKRFESRESTFMEGVENISRIVEEAKKELMKEKPSLEKIGELMNLNQFYLRRNLKVSGDCPISPSKLDALIQAAINAGALGAKLSGSGGGGAMIALCNPEYVEKVAKAIEEAGGKTYITLVAETGLRTEKL
jgi:galactokinase